MKNLVAHLLILCSVVEKNDDAKQHDVSLPFFEKMKRTLGSRTLEFEKMKNYGTGNTEPHGCTGAGGRACKCEHNVNIM